MKLINPEVRIENTNLCNADCTICSHNSMKRPKGTMETAFFEKLVRQAKDLGAKTISPFGFGEPLIDKNLEGKIAICDELGLYTFITTNGSLCTWDRIYDLFSCGLNHLRFSVHGLTKQDYENVHRGLKFNHVMTNILSTFYIKKYFPHVEISISVIPMHGESIGEIRQFWEHEEAVDYLEIWRPHNWSSKKNYRKRALARKHTCNRPTRGPLQIQWDGKVIPCCFLIDAELVLGDTHKSTLEEILKGQPYKELRERHEIGDLKGLPCEHCDQLNIEEISPLLYSNRDEEKRIDCTSSMKFKIN